MIENTAAQRQLAMDAEIATIAQRLQQAAAPEAGAKASNRGTPKRRPRTIEAALSYLEKASPAALATHRVRLVALAGRATAAPGAPTQPPVEQDQPPVASAVAAVLDCDSLFFQILNFCDAVGADKWWARELVDLVEQRVRGSNGSHLHIAAARGNRGLVEFLLHAGVPAELPMYDDLDGPHSRDPYSCGPPRPGRSYTPADWARNRGEVEVAKLLETYEHPERPRLITGEAYARGTLVRFNVEKGFGFIEPEQDEDEDELPDVFVHCLTFYAACAPWCSDRRSFFPESGQPLAYVVGKGKGGRPRAVRVANKRALSYIEAGHDVGGVYWDRATAICRWGEYVHMCRSYQEDSPDYYY